MSWSAHYRSCQERFRPLLRLGLSVIIGQVDLTLVGFADDVMMGHHSPSELAVTSFVSSFLNLVVTFDMGFSYGLAPLMATNKEWGRSDQVTRYLGHSFLLNLLIALLIGGGLFLLEGSFGTFNLSEELRPIVLPYYRIQILGFTVVMLFNTFKQYTEGVGDTQTPMYITLTGNVLSIRLNYLLIYGKGGFPEWGLYGAGLSTLASRVVILIAIVAMTVLSPHYRKILGRIKSLHWPWREGLVLLLQLDTPVALQMGMGTASFSVAVILITRINTAALTMHQIITTISALGFMAYYGIGAAAAICSSTLLAQEGQRETRYVTSAGVYLCLFVAAVMMPLLVLYCEPVMRLFSADLSIVEATYLALIPLCLYQIGDALQIVYANTLRGINHVTMLAPVAVLCHLIVAPTMAWLFSFGVKLEGSEPQLTDVWFAFLVSLTLLGLILRYSSHRATR